MRTAFFSEISFDFKNSSNDLLLIVILRMTKIKTETLNTKVI